jgi:hypothetical protein
LPRSLNEGGKTEMGKIRATVIGWLEFINFMVLGHLHKFWILLNYIWIKINQ